MSFMNDFKHKEISLKHVRSATKDFYDEPIGHGGFGKVYKGELSCPDGKRRAVAFKRLDRKSLQGRKEFWNEIMMLYDLTHENLVSLLYHCVEADEQILVYEYAPRGSLDRYLGDTSLTWSQRLRICLGAAHGLNYLHNPNKERENIIIHRDVKSSNILLDENWTAKISDLGLSKIAPTNQQHSYLISNVVGTLGYLDPLYDENGLLSKESDVYSFGVVLFEVMFGRLCYECRGNTSHFYLPTWKERLAQKRLDDVICSDKIDMDSLQIYVSIANQCLNKKRKERPTMANIIKELEIALAQQELSQDDKESTRFTENLRIANIIVTPPASCRSRKELTQLVSEGILLKGNKKVSLNKNGHVCEMIPAEYSILESSNEGSCSQSYVNCKAFTIDSNNQFTARTEYLSTDHVTYTINLLYKYGNDHSKGLRVPLRYKLEGETNYSTSCVAQRKDGLLRTELYQFCSNQKEHCFNIKLLSETRYGYHTPRYNHEFILEGIEFLPVEHVDRPVMDIDLVSEQKLLTEYVDVIKLSKIKFQSTSSKEVFDILRKGILINSNGKKWVSIKKNLKKICMIPAREVFKSDRWKLLKGSKSGYTWKTISESRFKEVAELLEINRFDIGFKLQNELLSHGTTYACYLVYKLPEERISVLEGMVHLQRHNSSVNTKQLFYLSTPPHTPIIGHTCDEPCINVNKTRKIKGHPKLRKDGWMEVQMWDFYNDANEDVYIKDHYCLNSYNNWYFSGLLVQGIEFRPAKVCFSPLC